MQIYMKLSQNDIDKLSVSIENARAARGLNYSQLAEISNVNQGQISRICHGKFKTISQNVMQICNTLGVSLVPHFEKNTDIETQDLPRLVGQITNGSSEIERKLARLLSALKEFSH